MWRYLLTAALLSNPAFGQDTSPVDTSPVDTSPVDTSTGVAPETPLEDVTVSDDPVVPGSYNESTITQDSTVTGDGSLSGDLSTYTGPGATVDSFNNTTNYNGAGSSPGSMPTPPVPTASAPMMAGGGGNDSCLIPDSSGVQISIIGVSRGKMTQDPECNRRKDSRLLGTPQAVGGLGLQVAGIGLMCQSAPVFKAMALSSTPCPITDIVTGKILVGRDAYVRMRQEPEVYVVGYAAEKHFWDSFLLMQLETLPDAPPEPERPSLSDRFRRNAGAGADNDRLVDQRADDSRSTE